DFRRRFFQSVSDLESINDIETLPSFGVTSLQQNQTGNTLEEFDLTDDLSRLNLVVSYTDSLNVVQEDTAVFAPTGVNYSRVSRNRSNSLLQGIEDSNDFTLANGQGVLDGVAGITTKIDLTALLPFFEENPDVLINQAEIEIQLSEESSRDNFSSFVFMLADESGNFFNPGLAINQFSSVVMTDIAYLRPVVNGAINSIPRQPTFSSEDMTLTADMTLFFQSLLSTSVEESTSGALDELFFASPVGEEVKRVASLVLLSVQDLNLGRNIIASDGITLNIFYTSIN
ncbi:MAG: hypothetical protein AAF789_08215, partial [Bacteroidota bacterium]